MSGPKPQDKQAANAADPRQWGDDLDEYGRPLPEYATFCYECGALIDEDAQGFCEYCMKQRY